MKIYLKPGDPAILWLAEATTRADAEGKSIRLEIDDSQHGRFIKYKVGEGAWSPPFYAPYSDPNASPYYGQRYRGPAGPA